MRYKYESNMKFPMVSLNYDEYKVAADKLRSYNKFKLNTWSGFWQCNYSIIRMLISSYGLSDQEAEDFAYWYMQPYFKKLPKSELDRGKFGCTEAILNKCEYKKPSKKKLSNKLRYTYA